MLRVLAAAAFLMIIGVLSGAQPHIGAQKTPPTPPLMSEDPQPGLSLLESSIGVLLQPFTVKEISLDPSTIESIRKIYSDLQTQQQALANKGGATDADFDKLRREADHNAIALLNARQLGRLEELALQAFTLDGFGIADVRSKLGLSNEQLGLIDAILKTWNSALDAYSEKVAAAAAANPSSNSNDPRVVYNESVKATHALKALQGDRKKLAETKAALLAKVLDLLSQEQRRNYNAMLGVKVKVVDTI